MQPRINELGNTRMKTAQVHYDPQLYCLHRCYFFHVSCALFRFKADWWLSYWRLSRIWFCTHSFTGQKPALCSAVLPVPFLEGAGLHWGCEPAPMPPHPAGPTAGRALASAGYQKQGSEHHSWAEPLGSQESWAELSWAYQSWAVQSTAELSWHLSHLSRLYCLQCQEAGTELTSLLVCFN